MHFDEMQLWVVKEIFQRDPKRNLTPQDFKDYYLLGLSDAMLAFKETNIRFVITGTNIEQGGGLRITRQVKTKTLYLPHFSEEAILEILGRLCNIEHLDTEHLKTKVATPLAGCPRSCEYFFTKAQERLDGLPTNEVTVDTLAQVSSCSFVAKALKDGRFSLQSVVYRCGSTICKYS
jgi:hypothetical protein